VSGAEQAQASGTGGARAELDGGHAGKALRLSVLALTVAACGAGEPGAGTTRQALGSTSVVVSQVFGGGGSPGTPAPPWRTDFIELHNVSDQPVPLGGLSLQYAAALGNNWLVADFDPAATIEAGAFHLVALTQTTGPRGLPLPTPDTVNVFLNVSTDFKVALVAGVTPLTGVCPLPNAQVIDFVGVGTANCQEGAATASAASVTTAVVRKNAGCQDTDQSAADFELLAPAPMNSAVVVRCFVDGGTSFDAGGVAVDAGAGAADAGRDAGSSLPDAGALVRDAGPVDAGDAVDAGGAVDAGRSSAVDAGAVDGGTAPSLVARPGCGCSGSGAELLGLMGLWVWRKAGRRGSTRRS
jgi:hypothetical protein